VHFKGFELSLGPCLSDLWLGALPIFLKNQQQEYKGMHPLKSERFLDKFKYKKR
jgi:hypothetical protein